MRSSRSRTWTGCLAARSRSPITIERKDQSEKRDIESGTAKPSSSPASGEASVAFTPGAASVSADEDNTDGASNEVSGSADLSRLAATANKKQPRVKKDAGSTGVVPGGSGQLPPGASTPPDAADATKTEDAAPDTKLVGRSAVRWTQTNQADFERGTTHAAGISSAGDLRLAPGLHSVKEITEPFIWSLAPGPGVTYAGTGNGGLIEAIKPNGDTETFFKTGDLEVHALARDKQGICTPAPARTANCSVSRRKAKASCS